MVCFETKGFVLMEQLYTATYSSVGVHIRLQNKLAHVVTTSSAIVCYKAVVIETCMLLIHVLPDLCYADEVRSTCNKAQSVSLEHVQIYAI